MGGGGSSETPKLYYVIYEQPLMSRLTRVHVHQVQVNGVYVHYDHEWDRCLFVCLFSLVWSYYLILFDSN